MAYKNHRDLKIWQVAMDLCTNVYRLTKELPSDERFVLVQQMCKSAVSIPSNIGEGHGRNTPAELKRFCSIALGSLAELETQILIAERLYTLAPTGDIHRQIEHLRKMLFRFGQSIVREDRVEYGFDFPDTEN